MHHAQHELVLNQSRFGHAVPAHIVGLLSQTSSTDGGEVIKDKRQILINQRPQQIGYHIVHGLLVVHERIHAAQELLMHQTDCVHLRNADRFQPTLHAEF
jgi:hypothetical protein